MAKNLVIVESPAKAKTIEKFLGKDFSVKSSFGHVRDLSKKDLSVDLEKGFIPNYEIPADKKKTVKELKQLAKGESPEKVLEVLSASLTNKFLHAPTQSLNQAQDSERQTLLDAVHRIYHLHSQE